MDPRAARTRMRLQEALLLLAQQRSLDSITVGDITAAAGVNRSSFYQHYAEKETLLADALEQVVDNVSDQLLARRDELDEGIPVELLHYLTHIEQNADLYRRVLSEHGSSVVSTRLHDRVTAIVSDAVAHAEAAAFTGMPVDIAAGAIAGTAMGVVKAWISRDPLPPAEVAVEWLWRALSVTGAPAESDRRL